MKNLDAIYFAARELPSADRAAFLAQACAGDDELLKRVQQMLAVSAAAEAFITDVPDDAGEDRTSDNGSAERLKLAPAAAPDEAVGQMLGRYKLLERVGEGGCGVVYVAEQTEPVRRRVALKVIKLGMDTKQVVARFEAERQALAMMDHPNIAKVLDAGTTEVGRPYFVMELVRGIKITDYCDQAKLTTRERLDLFIKVCQAIQHAHQKGIIHRDIKPSNILVTLHDGVPVPKVIDFGIAKATEGRLTNATVYTQFHQFIGTPAYMSPEQAEMSGLDIDTRSDIYSLGVLLYELLAGSTPFDAKELMASGIDAMRKTIREKEPMRPSTRLATLQGEELTTTVKRRSADAPKLLHQLKGDLDWIVMKCLEKDRQRRYETANGLAADLKRHLGNEPVVARPPSSLYRVQKFARRNQLAFAAAGAVLAALVLGLGLSSWQMIRAMRSERNEQKARLAAEAARTQESEQRSLADANAHRATQSQQSAQRLLYAADLRLAHHAWEEGNLTRMESLMEAHRTKPGGADSRGIEYFLLQALAGGEQQQILRGNTNPILGLGLSPDGKWLASRTDSAMQLWDLAARQPVATWPSASVQNGSDLDGALSCTFSYDSQYLAVEAEAGLQLCHIPTLQTRLIVTGRVWQATFSPVTNWISYDDSPASPRGPRIESRVWDYLAGILVRSSSPSAHLLGWSPNGARLLTGRWRHELSLWDVGGRNPQPAILPRELARERVMAAAFSPSERLMAAADWQGAVYFWDMVEPKTSGTITSGDARPTALAFSPDGKFLATGSGNPAIQLWDVATRQLVRKLRGHQGKVSGLAFTPDGRTLVSGAMDGTVRLWNPFGQTDRSRITNMLASFGANPPKFSPDGKWLGLRTVRPTLRLLDTTRLQLSASIAGDLVSFSPESEQYATLLQGSGSALQVWTMGGASNRAGIQLELSAAEQAFCPQLSPDGTILSLQTIDGTTFGIELFQAATGERLLSLGNVSGASAASCFLPKGRTGAYANGSRIQFWDVQSRSNTFSLQCDGDVEFFSISPDEKTLAASLSDHQISVWDVDSRSKVGTLVGHQAGVFSLAFSPDGRTLASGSEDRTIKLWHLATHRELASFSQERAVYWLAFSPDNQLLVSGGLGAYQLWRAPRGDAAVTSSASSPAAANLPTNSIWRLPDGPDRSPPRMVAEKNVCLTNLLKIHAAIMAYRKDHGHLPDGLGDLGPTYLSDINSLICPVQARTGKIPNLLGMEDRKVASSYSFEFTARTKISEDPYGVGAPGDTMRAWKEKQLARYGPVVPVVRCWLHPNVLSVTWEGESRVDLEPAWEAAAERTLREKPAARTNATPIPH